MGLDTTHGAFHGAYSSFSRWRNAIEVAAGYPLVKDERGHTYPSNINWNEITEANLMGEWETTPEDPLVVLIAHSDCDGAIYPAQAGPLADRLEELLPKIPSGDDYEWGHITRDGGLVAVTKNFIAGLRTAVAAGEPLGFH